MLLSYQKDHVGRTGENSVSTIPTPIASTEHDSRVGRLIRGKKTRIGVTILLTLTRYVSRLFDW